MDNREIDIKIKESLSNTADKIIPEDRFEDIRLKLQDAGNSSAWASTFIYPGLKLKRAVAAFVCAIFVFAVLSFIFSENARATAIDTINKINTIFVVDKEDGEYKVVEKNAADAKEPYFAVSTSTVLSETEIENMLGFKLHFPETINDYKLVDRGIGLILQKSIDYESYQNLQPSMLAAIDDESGFKKLGDYKPLRDISYAYKNSERMIFIEANNGKTWQSALMSKSNSIVDAKVGDINGKWIELPFPVYPMKEGSGTGGLDYSQRPTEIRIMHALTWKAGNINYLLTSYSKTSEPPLDDMVKTAETFMANINSQKDFKTVIVYEIQSENIADSSINGIINTLDDRYKAFGFKDIAAASDGEKRISVTVTGDQKLDSIATALGNQNRLRFIGPDDQVELTGKDIKGAAISNDALLVQFTNEGKSRLYEVTTNSIDKPLKIYLDDKLLIAPIIRAPISDGRVMLTGLDSSEDLQRLATILKCGKELELPLKVVKIEAVK